MNIIREIIRLTIDADKAANLIRFIFNVLLISDDKGGEDTAIVLLTGALNTSVKTTNIPINGVNNKDRRIIFFFMFCS
jgi:hypothetical protein